MKNYIQEGDTLDLIAPSGGVVAGNGYLIGGVFVIAATTAAAGATFTGSRVGVYDLAAVGAGSGQAIAQGGLVYWDSTAQLATAVSTGNTLIGAATVGKLTTDTDVNVLLFERTFAPAPVITPVAATAPTNSTPYGFTQAQAVALIAAVNGLIAATEAGGLSVPH